MNGHELRAAFLQYWKDRGHTIVPSSSLLPDDPSVLLTTAGMQQFKPYYTGNADPIKDFGTHSTATSQKCFRTSDIENIGDDTHHTFFEMLGNFSFGGYFKKEAISYAYDFLTNTLGLTISYVTIFEGSDVVPKDLESRDIWAGVGVADVREEGMDDVFWGPTGSGGPCGPTTEIYCTNANGEDVEVWNIVFNEFVYNGTRDELLAGAQGKSLEPIKSKGIDTGMGLERLAMIIEQERSTFETTLFEPLTVLIPVEVPERVRRICADHLRASAFLIADGVRPANKGAGYILRRLLRRVESYASLHKIPTEVLDSIVTEVISGYASGYPELSEQADSIHNIVSEERAKFTLTLARGLKELNRRSASGLLSPEDAFTLYETFGIPFDIIRDFGGEATASLTEKDFDASFVLHQEKSRAGLEKKFGGHGLLLDTGELKAKDEEELSRVTRLHTATHLLQAALRKVLGDDVMQRGSDITTQRTRFDFSFNRKLTQEERSEVEGIVNDAIAKDYAVTMTPMPIGEAKRSGALYFFREKYPDVVNVYTVGEQDDGTFFSREFCGGPHVTHTGEIGEITILKEEASSAGVRRIRATLQK